MKLSPLILMLDVLLDLIDRQMRRGARPPGKDLVRLGKRLRRGNRLYVRLVSRGSE